MNDLPPTPKETITAPGRPPIRHADRARRNEPLFIDVLEWAKKQPEAYAPTLGWMEQIYEAYQARGKEKT